MYFHPLTYWVTEAEITKSISPLACWVIKRKIAKHILSSELLNITKKLTYDCFGFWLKLELLLNQSKWQGHWQAGLVYFCLFSWNFLFKWISSLNSPTCSSRKLLWTSGTSYLYHCPLAVLRFDLNQFWNESNSNRSQYTYLFSSSSLVSSSGTDESPVIDRSNSFDLLFHTHFISLDPSTYYISLTPCTNYRVNNWQC